jgi:hypothetical protein
MIEKGESYENSTFYEYAHCKKRLATFPSPAGMSLTKLFLGGNNLISNIHAWWCSIHEQFYEFFD